ncbi:MAG: ATP-binding protein, partial [Thermoplasmata archaeon]|nr:ATP-binding protein [Thermoplasmata archaeon]
YSPLVSEGKERMVAGGVLGGVAGAVLHELHKTLESQGYAFLLYKYASDEAIIQWSEQDYLKMIATEDDIYLETNKTTNISSRIVEYQGRKIRYFGSLKMHQNKWRTYPDNENVLLAPNSLLISSELLKLAQKYMMDNWARIANLGITLEVAREISRLVNEEYINITIEPFFGGKLSIFSLLADGSRIRLGDLGSGAQVYIIAKLLYALNKPQILLWDDIEAHMNPKMLISIAEWLSELSENGVQVVVATHSIETARIIAEFNKNASIMITSLENGMLKTKKISVEELEDLLSAGIDVRMAEGLII